MDNWKEVLEFYHKKYQYPFVVQKIDDYPYPWINYGTDEYNNFIKKEGWVSQREVFADEIVFDIDMEDGMELLDARNEAREIAEEISERLKNFGYSHKVYMSGGSGAHIHAFFPELFSYNNIDNRVLKKSFLKIVGQGYIRPRGNIHGKVQTQSLTTIQIEYGRHRSGGKKKLISEYDSGQVNVLKPIFLDRFKKEKEKNNLFRKHYRNSDKEIPDAIKFLEKEQFYRIKDGRERALFVLTAFYKSRIDDDKELFKKLMEWNKKVLKGYFDAQTIKAKIRSARPCLPIQTLIDLFDELGIDHKHLGDLEV